MKCSNVWNRKYNIDPCSRANTGTLLWGLFISSSSLFIRSKPFPGFQRLPQFLIHKPSLQKKERKLSVFCNIMAQDCSQRYQQWSWRGLGLLRLTADKLFRREKLFYWHAVWCWSKLGMQEKQIAPRKEMGGVAAEAARAAGAAGAVLPSAAETDSFPPVHFPLFRKVCRSDCGFGDI